MHIVGGVVGGGMDKVNADIGVALEGGGGAEAGEQKKTPQELARNFKITGWFLRFFF